MPLVLSMALAHLRARTRQTLVSVIGVATGVGFSIAMAALMQGSQLDFINKIIDATPHILIKDEFREPPLQPAARSLTAAVCVSTQHAQPGPTLIHRLPPMVLVSSATTVTPDGMLRPTSAAALSGEALMAVLLTQT